MWDRTGALGQTAGSSLSLDTQPQLQDSRAAQAFSVACAQQRPPNPRETQWRSPAGSPLPAPDSEGQSGMGPL